MRYTYTLFFLIIYLLTSTRAGQNDMGGMFPPRDLSANIIAKDVAALLRRTDSPIQVQCMIDHAYDDEFVEPPDMIRSARILITGLPDAEDHADNFKKAVEDACVAANLLQYSPKLEPTDKSSVAVDLVLRDALFKEPFTPVQCIDDAIKKLTGRDDLPPCPDTGF
jgi:hypothetical protein